MENADEILCLCDLEVLKDFTIELETKHTVAVVKEPGVCLTMIRAEDSLEKQEFFLGEALTSECEVTVDGSVGYGLCLGEEPIRAYCVAVMDALIHGGGEVPSEVTRFLAEQGALLEQADQEAFSRVLSTRVDFKLMEEA